jgi:hydrogenase expression/formation protein HypC
MTMCLGIPGLVVRVEPAAPGDPEGLRMATVDFGGVRRAACLAYTPEADVGDYVVVHVGFAISRVDAAEAARTLAVIQAIPDAFDSELGDVYLDEA